MNLMTSPKRDRRQNDCYDEDSKRESIMIYREQKMQQNESNDLSDKRKEETQL